MRTPTTITEPADEAIVPEWRGRESPKGFFQYLRANNANLHHTFSKSLHQAGFQVRWITRRVHHGIWSLYLLRGTVPRGSETARVREVLCDVLRRCGYDVRKREIEVSPIGDRIGVAFIYAKGTIGTLAYSKGRESWIANEWP